MRPQAVLASAVAALLLASTGPAPAVDRDVYKEIRGRYEGMTLRLRVDLMAARRALPPNIMSLDGMSHARENAPVLFGRLEKVFLERVTNAGKTRLELTVYRNHEEADRLRASAIPQPMGGNPLAGRTLAAFAQQGSTSVILELRAGKNEPQEQLSEAETLLDRLFFLKSEPSREELEDFVRKNHGLSLGRLRDLTGLPAERVRELLREAGGDGDPARPAEP